MEWPSVNPCSQNRLKSCEFFFPPFVLIDHPPTNLMMMRERRKKIKISSSFEKVWERERCKKCKFRFCFCSKISIESEYHTRAREHVPNQTAKLWRERREEVEKIYANSILFFCLIHQSTVDVCCYCHRALPSSHHSRWYYSSKNLLSVLLIIRSIPFIII